MISDFVTYIIHFLESHTVIGLIIVFLITFVESLPILGSIIPGTITMTAVGTLMGSGSLPLTSTLIVGVLGSYLGDIVSFIIGKRYKDRIKTIWPFRKILKLIESCEKFIKKHGIKALIIGRFVGVARSTTPMVAGLLDMQWGKFFIAGFLSSFAWMIVYVVPGILIGYYAVSLPEGLASKLIIAIIALLIFSAIIYYLFRISYHFIKSKLINLSHQIYLHTQNTTKRFYAITNKWLYQSHSQRPELQIASILGVILLSAMFLLVFILMATGTLNTINQAVFHLLQSLRESGVDTLMVIISSMFSTKLVALEAIILALILLLCKKKDKAAAVAATTVLCFIITAAIKVIYFEARPHANMVMPSSSSFPSGHTAMTASVFLISAYIMSKELGYYTRKIPFYFATTIISLVILSRLYLGEHWLFDTVASLLIASSCYLIGTVVYRRLESNQKVTSLWLKSILIFLFIYILPGAILTQYHTLKSRDNYRPYSITRTISAHKLIHDNKPLYRLNRLGKPEQPLNLKWVSSLHKIQHQLSEHGWNILNKEEAIKELINRFNQANKIHETPMLSWQYQFKKPVLIASKNIDKDTIAQIFLWDSMLRIKSSNTPIWYGSIFYHHEDKTYASLMNFIKYQYHQQDALTLLTSFLNKKQYHIIRTHQEQPEKIHKLKWTGRTIIINQ